MLYLVIQETDFVFMYYITEKMTIDSTAIKP